MVKNYQEDVHRRQATLSPPSPNLSEGQTPKGEEGKG